MLKNNLIELLSNIIHDRLQMLSDTKKDMKKTDSYKKVEDIFSDVNNIIDVDDNNLKAVLLDITDDDTADQIISNVDMIKIILKGKNSGLDLSLDDSQLDLVKGVYEIVNSHRVELEESCAEEKVYLESFISKCEKLSSEIGSGVVRDIDTLDEIFNDNNIPIDEVINSKFEILRNNSKNYNLNLNGKVKEEVDLRIVLRQIDVDFDSYSDIEKKLLLDHSSKDNVQSIVDYISDNDINLSSSQLFILFLFSNVSIFSNVYEISKSYDMNFDQLFCMPGVFISKETNVSDFISEYRDDELYYVIESLCNIIGLYEVFVDNISLLEANNLSVTECFKNNILCLIIPDLSKNITILSSLKLSNKDFSIIVINPFLATSMSSFKECGLSEYIDSNPLRLTTSYFRFKIISSNIITARKNGQVIFRSLSDKKNYWLNKSITRKSEVI